jgi:hypothetical protein
MASVPRDLRLENAVGEMGSVVLEIECNGFRLCPLEAALADKTFLAPMVRLIVVGIRSSRPSHSDFTEKSFCITEAFPPWAIARLLKSPE